MPGHLQVEPRDFRQEAGDYKIGTLRILRTSHDWVLMDQTDTALDYFPTLKAAFCNYEVRREIHLLGVLGFL